MRGYQGHRRQEEKLDSIYLRTVRYWLSAIYEQCKLDPVTYLHVNDRLAYGGYNYITDKELAHSLTLILLSAGGAGIGIGQLLTEFLK